MGAPAASHEVFTPLCSSQTFCSCSTSLNIRFVSPTIRELASLKSLGSGNGERSGHFCINGVTSARHCSLAASLLAARSSDFDSTDASSAAASIPNSLAVAAIAALRCSPFNVFSQTIFSPSTPGSIRGRSSRRLTAEK